ncbi:MAG TPA: sialate O-acetylesterase [Planctomycetaceae bacterium]|jgi:sialate O-acetylesterase|nr:sialate O-acetylesterase [Planctomycetaceae bacterium]
MSRIQRIARIVAFASAVSAWGLAQRTFADVHLPHIFGDHMVLQRDKPIRIWGSAEPGEKVQVSIGKDSAETSADEHRKWKLELPALPASTSPIKVTVTGNNTIVLDDVLVGEVWLCSGQSNMQMNVGSSLHARKEIDQAKHPEIRLFNVPMRPAGEPAHDVNAAWAACTPKTVPGFTAVGYFFGRDLHEQLGVPIGLIESSWGGTRIEPWTPPIGFRDIPALAPIVDGIAKAKAAYADSQSAALSRYAKWLEVAQKAKSNGEPIPSPPEWPVSPLATNIAPTGLYNGMIHPLVPFSIRGALWYQGESNNGEGMLYFDKMKALIDGWRSVWHEGDFPFLYVQLAPFRYGPKAATALPHIWEAQTAALALPDTGMAVTNDIGDPKDIHPKDKQDVGKRLALWALAKTYGKQIVYSGPLYKSMSIDGSKIRVKFEHVGGGLVARNGKPLDWFQIAGDDKKFVDAEAIIDGDSVVVSSPKVAKPVAVRYAFDQIAEPNLQNVEGLPASAFRTDKW